MLETTRTILRALQEGDVHAIYHNWTSKEEVTKYLTWPTHTSIETTKIILQGWLEDQDAYRYGIEWKENHDLIGMIDIVDFVSGCPEIGYVLSPDYWNHGIMSEVFSKVCEDLFTKYPTIYIRAVKENIGSNKVILKNGFTYLETKEEVRSRFFPDEIVSINYYKKDRD